MTLLNRVLFPAPTNGEVRNCYALRRLFEEFVIETHGQNENLRQQDAEEFLSWLFNDDDFPAEIRRATGIVRRFEDTCPECQVLKCFQ